MKKGGGFNVSAMTDVSDSTLRDRLVHLEAWLDATLPHLATKADLERLRGQVLLQLLAGQALTVGVIIAVLKLT